MQAPARTGFARDERSRPTDSRPSLAARAREALLILRAAAEAARQEHEQARHAPAEAERRRDDELGWFGALGCTPDPGAALADLDRDIAADEQELAAARARIAQLQAEPPLPPSGPTGSPQRATPGAPPATSTATRSSRAPGGRRLPRPGSVTRSRGTTRCPPVVGASARPSGADLRGLR
jgi:hypothetical protein